MPTPAPSVGRPADRKNSILQHLRLQIAGGEWLPGSQLPTRSEIGEQFGASPVTVQSALEHLRRDGFIVVNGKQGTYVAPQPPHLTNYGLVFPSQPANAGWVRFWTALSEESAKIAEARKIKITLYHNVHQHHDSDDYQLLAEEVCAHRIGGLIFATPPFEVKESPILDEPGIPRVAIMAPSTEFSFPNVCTDEFSFWDRAIDYLKAQGKTDVAVLMPPYNQEIVDQTQARLIAAGLNVEPQWVQRVHQSAPETGLNLMHLLMHPSQTRRPNALIISDDNLVEPALKGLLRAGVKSPDELEVVAHCNFPYDTSDVMPVKRLGYDARQVLNTCLASIEEQRKGYSIAHNTPIYALFEDEVSE